MKVPRALFLIFLLALFVRVIQLGIFPVGFHADEVRVGWNAYSILQTLKDDRGNLFALYYNTFGDHRPTGIFYITIPSLLIFGLTQFAVRFPSAIFGALTVFPIYFLALSLTKQKKVALLSAFFLALSPWHISVSRATSEVVISMFFALCALASLKKHQSLTSIILFAFSYSFYHSIRLLAPLFVFVIKPRLSLVLSVLIVITGILFLTAGGRGRFSQVSILQSNEQVLGIQTQRMFFDASVFTFVENFASQYSSYFSGAFLIGDAAKPLRYVTPNIGVVTFAEIILVSIGIFLCIQGKANKTVLFLLLVSIVPAALTNEDSPNLHRALFMTPFLAILVAFGSDYILNKNRFLFAGLLVLFCAQWMFYWHSYTDRALYAFGGVRNEAAKELALYLNEVHAKYEEVIITNDPDDPYPWFAFFNKKDPREFNKFAIKRSEGPWSYQNLVFTQKDCPSGDVFPNKLQTPLEKNVLVVDAFKCPVESKIKDGMQARVHKQFFNPDRSVAYTLWEKN